MSQLSWDISGDYWNFDVDYYVKNYPDLQGAVNNMNEEEKKQFLINHFYRHGFGEGRLYRWTGMPPCRCYPRCEPWNGCRMKSGCNCEKCMDKGPLFIKEKPPSSEVYEIYDNRIAISEKDDKDKSKKSKCSVCKKKKCKCKDNKLTIKDIKILDESTPDSIKINVKLNDFRNKVKSSRH
jgi:hypothetical protein